MLISKEENKMKIHRYCLMSRNGEPDMIFDSYVPYIMTGIVCKPEEMVYSITFEECNSDEYDMVAWKKKENNEIDYIYKNKNLISVCFPYGLDSEIKLGRGEIVYLKIVEYKECGIARELENHRAEWDIK